MVWHRPVFNRGRAFTDRDHILDLSVVTAFLRCVFRAPDGALWLEVLLELFLKHTAGLNE
jgi:hypothetical protein